MCACVSLYMYMCVFVCVLVSLYVYDSTCVSMCVYVCLCMYPCVSLYVYVCDCLCMCRCVFVLLLVGSGLEGQRSCQLENCITEHYGLVEDGFFHSINVFRSGFHIISTALTQWPTKREICGRGSGNQPKNNCPLTNGRLTGWLTQGVKPNEWSAAKRTVRRDDTDRPDDCLNEWLDNRLVPSSNGWLVEWVS